MAAKISLALIARNAGSTLRRTLESARPYVDEIVVGLGGPSDDNTPEIARELADRVVEIDWRDDFAYARNLVWQNIVGVPGDDSIPEDWVLWLDADDELVGGENLRKVVDEAMRTGANTVFATYEYERDEQGNLTCVLVRERLVQKPSVWKWTGRVHEILQMDEGEPFAPTYSDEFKVVHQWERPRDKGERNLVLLYRELAETEPEPALRCLLYLCRENAIRGNHREALTFGERYMALARRKGGTDDEGGQVAHIVADTYRAIGDLDRAEQADLLATRLAPTFPDGYLGLAKTAYLRGNWSAVVRFTQAASAYPVPRTSLIINELDYNFQPLWFLGLAYAQMGDNEMAIANLRRAASIRPDPELVKVLGAIEREADMQNVLTAYKTLADHLGRWDEWLKVRKLLEVAPKLIEQHPDVSAMVMRVMAQTAHIDDNQLMIDLYRGNPGWYPADDATILDPNAVKFPRTAFALKSLCEPPKYVLDIGSSDGFISLPLAMLGHHVTGLDYDPRCIDLANSRSHKWGLWPGDGNAGLTKGSAQYKVGGIEDLHEDVRYDVALAMEIIEHLVDPGAFLDEVDKHVQKVVITTPFLAWDLPNSARLVNTLDPKYHIRIFDLGDMERLVAHRGRVLDLYREPFGNSAWIFASYRPGDSYEGTVTFIAPGTLEEWSPRKLKEQGLGGSETALIRVAEELAAKYKILPTTFGRIDNPGYYNGVRYRQWDAYLPEVRQDATIAWRYPEAADIPGIEGPLFLWVHDVDFGDRLTVARAMRFERIIVLSEWHCRHFLEKYPWLPASKMLVIGNGVDPARFTSKPAPKRNNHRVAYTSSADRGLDAILEHVWPKVVERVPDAELHVYYGWGNFKTLETVPGYKHLGVFRERVAKLMLDTTNVVQHGRVPQDELAQELRRASVWLGPSHDFDETFCISAVEAQLAGCIPIHSGRAALAETVKSGLTVDGRIGSDEGVADLWVRAIVDTLTADEKQLAAARKKVIGDAAAQSWEQVADQWHRLVLNESTGGQSRSATAVGALE